MAPGRYGTDRPLSNVMSPSWGRLQGGISELPSFGGPTQMQRGWVVSPEYRDLIDVMAAYRREVGVSQRELARRLGKPPSFVNKIELFERRLDILEYIAIAEALGQKPGVWLQALRTNLPQQISI
jgi:hypothetical protein